ncbi:hypothetical protein F6Y05_36995 [Bacillus megaterium]|nr:hypothetical protein [Priestia megaterium]
MLQEGGKMILINNCEDRNPLLFISGEHLESNEKFNLYLLYDEKTLKWKKDLGTNPKITEAFCEAVVEIAKNSPHNKTIKEMETRDMEIGNFVKYTLEENNEL